MATYDTVYYTTGTYDSGTGIFTADGTGSVAGNNTTTDNEGSGQPGETTFEVGDNLTATGDNGGGGQYVGHTGDGFVAEQGGSYYYFSNSPLPPGGTTPVDPGDFAVCFLGGTLIAAPGGPRTVETLVIGDRVLTASGDVRLVKWIGRQEVVAVFAPPLKSFPVRIARGALAENVPARDLYVSPAHGIVLDGLLVEAASLVNGTTITRVLNPEPRFVWYHIETEDHAIILAEGAPVETFLDSVTRARFDNFSEFIALYGEQDQQKEEFAAPRVKSARQLPAAIRIKLAKRAEALGHVMQATA
ncbi:Hint domain-containing protein [Roseococcus sp. YIM B11640]|uniref:Hint domain-containing protein n=1 Tax=Roseococcus sp. YIM B11640 TaxID=3133973 RepID=UPI003C7E10C2